ncbi:MAG: branched-chain amino acid transport system ATP-binding protein [Solirubrobacteraceae bacterium]|nr:branched-chain amino acid transport system ATP-binding protein [Solirubrobacteraceae bacterium]
MSEDRPSGHLTDILESAHREEHELDEDAPLLSLRGVGVSFGGVRALVDVNFDVQAHRIVAVVGPNGAGKTTLLNAMGGMLRKVSGDISLRGTRITGKKPSQLARAGFGRSFQDPRLIEAETALENVLSGAHLTMGYGTLDQLIRPWHVRRQEALARERAMALLDFVGLGHTRDLTVSSLPYGSRKLIDIARAMAGSPEILMLDEPSSGVDQAERDVIAEVLRELRSGHRMTVVIVEHHMDLVRAVADQVVGMAAGSAIAVGTPSEVLDSESFRAAIVGIHGAVAAPTTTASDQSPGGTGLAGTASAGRDDG